MKHEDFNSLEIMDVLATISDYAQGLAPQARLYWISTELFAQIEKATDNQWQWVFDSAQVLGTHIYSRHEESPWNLYSLWKGIHQAKPDLSQASLVQLSEGPCVLQPFTHCEKLLGYWLFVGADKLSKVSSGMAKDEAIAAKYLHFAYTHAESRRQSYIDELTGLYNQRYLPMVLDHEIDRARRAKQHFSVLFLDIDYFKMVNDSRGHWVGSRLLGEMAGIIRGQVRSVDYCFRYGGDEFLVVLVGTSPENARRVAERIRKAVEDQAFVVDGHNMKLTVSIGLASYPDHAQSAQNLIQLADQAMYYGKNKSRNIVFVAS